MDDLVRASWRLGGAIEGGACKPRLVLEYSLAPGYVLALGFGGGACVEPLPGGGARLVVPPEALLGDAARGLLGGALAGLVLAPPERIDGDVSLLERAAAVAAYEELERLRRRLGLLWQHLVSADIGPLAARAARLARLHRWLRPLYSEAYSTAKGYRWLRRLSKAYSRRVMEPAAELHGRLEDAAAEARSITRRSLVARLLGSIEKLSIAPLLPAELLVKGLGAQLPPPLRDPLLFFRLDSARLATRLVGFEQQLAALIGVAGLLRGRRFSPLRTVSRLEAAGFTPAVIKRYRDPAAAKWLIVAVASLQLPKPRLQPRKRLEAEYHYNRVLASLGVKVPRPLLVDPRRMLAAYSYIEGRTLAEELGENPLHPHYFEYASLLARLHSEGIALWDTNPTNVVASPAGLYLVDLEQARDIERTEDKAMDIAVAVYYTIPYSPAAAAERAARFAKAYIDAGGDPEAVAEAAKYRYAAPFMAIAPPLVVEKARRGLAHAASRGD